MLESLTNPDIWVALFEIAVINVLLSGDNAIVIALACRSLPAKQQKQAFLIGAAGIVVLMTALTAFAAYLLTLPYLEVIGSLLLVVIAVKLLIPSDEDDGDVSESASFWGAVKTIIIADIVMSLDNVLGMAGAARGHLGMLFVGMVITIPLILFGSALIMRLMERYPVFITLGAGLLGWVAGEMAVADPAFKDSIETNARYLEYFVPILGAASVVIVGKVLSHRRGMAAASAVTEPAATPVRDLAA